MDEKARLTKNSTIEAVIKKFHTELKKKDNTRTLTIEANHRKDVESDRNIDRQLTDLELLIKKLQDEIEVMAKNADKIPEDYTTDSKTVASNKIVSKTDTVYPIIVNNAHPSLRSDIENVGNKIQSPIPEVTTFQILESVTEVPNEEIQPPEKQDTIENLICELKAEISEKMKELKDIDLGNQLNNSMDELE